MNRFAFLTALVFLTPPVAYAETTAHDLCKMAFGDYKTKLTKNPLDEASWSEFRACVIELKRWHEGAEVSALAAQSHPELWQPHLLIGIGHFHMKEYPQAVDEFKEAARLKNDEPLPHYYLGMSYLFMNQPGDAAPAAEQAVALDPNNPMYYRQEAYAYLLLDQNDPCEAAAKKAIALDSNDIAAWKILGNLYAKEGRQADSEQAYEQAMHANGRAAVDAHPAAVPTVTSIPAIAPGPPTEITAVKDTDSIEESVGSSHAAVDICKANWTKMQEAVARGKLATALTYFSDYAGTRDEYQASFARLGMPKVQQIFAGFGTLHDCQVVFGSATCQADVKNAYGAVAGKASVRFERGPDRGWRIRSF